MPNFVLKTGKGNLFMAHLKTYLWVWNVNLKSLNKIPNELINAKMHINHKCPQFCKTNLYKNSKWKANNRQCETLSNTYERRNKKVETRNLLRLLASGKKISSKKGT